MTPTLPLMKTTLILAALLTVVVGCDDDLEMEMAADVDPAQVATKLMVRVSPDQVCSDTSFTNTAGETVQGTRNCTGTFEDCKAMGDTGCMMKDAALYGITDANLMAQNIKKGIPFLGVQGTMAATKTPCEVDGASDCIVPEDAIAVTAADLTAKVVTGQTVAGVAGGYDPGFPRPNEVLDTDTVNGVPGTIPACAADGDTSCLADATYRAVDQSDLVADHIRNTVTLGGVTGTYAGAFGDCTADSETNCISTSRYISVDTTGLEAAKIRANIVLAGVTGSLTERAADCGSDGAVNCTTTAAYPSADFDHITAGNIKKGTLFAGVMGDYPSANHKLATDTGTEDLTAGNFDASLASAAAFEYWDAAGNLYSGNGDTDLTAANVLTGTELFNITGNLPGTPAACSATLSVDCVASVAFPAFDAAKLIPANIKKDVTLANADTSVIGGYPSADHRLGDDTLATTDLTAAGFHAALASASNFEYWDSAGVKHTYAGSTDLVGTNIVTGTTLFSVAGSVTRSPNDCADGLLTACVTTGSFPSYDPAVLTEGLIKSGTTIGSVAGKYPSADYPLAGADGTLDLTQDNFLRQLREATPFEFFDSSGVRYTSQGDTQLVVGNLRSGLDILGLTGTVTGSSAPCSAGDVAGCVANASFPAFVKADLTAAVIRNGETVMGITGTYPSAANPMADALPAMDDLGNQADLYTRLASGDDFEFWDGRGIRFVRSGTANLTAANIVSGANLFGIDGAMTEQLGDCTSDGEEGCVSTTTYPAFEKAALTEGLIKGGFSIGGVVGKYPSADYPFPDASGTADLNEVDFANQVSQAGTFEYWDAAGTRHTKTISANLLATEVLTGENIFGVDGSATTPPAACNATSQSDCITSANYPSHDPGEFTAGIIKAGETIAGTVGQYPSATHKLNEDTNIEELTSGDFNALITGSNTFEYWDSSGSRYTATGEANIAADNIKKDVTIFGVTGDRLDASGSTLTANQIRYGVTINGVTGTMRLNCRNGRKNGIEVDDYFGARTAGPDSNAWGAAHSCWGEIFEDLTADGGCDASKTSCRFRDTVTGLKWLSLRGDLIGGDDWEQAKTVCSGAGARLPTQKEMFTAYIHGFSSVIASVNDWELYSDSDLLWTATTASYNTVGTKALIFAFENPTSAGLLKTDIAYVMCVKY